MGVPLVEVTRSGVVESTHRGSVVALRPDGTAALALGEVEHPVFPRSANKPLQAVGLLELGWSPVDDEQVALACASHSGEPEHLAVVRRVLGAVPESALGCPPSLPLGEAAMHAVLTSGGAPTRLQMNCSGKHAAMLSTCAARGWPVEDYLDAGSALQQSLLRTVERLASEPVAAVAVDGCGAPQHALTLTGLARAFARLVRAAPDTDEGRVASAVRAFPHLVGGTGRDVTLLMDGLPGLLAKDGAEGVYAAALPDGSAVALKIDDGSARARTPVLAAALRALGANAPVLSELSELPVLGGERPVGAVRAVRLIT